MPTLAKQMLTGRRSLSATKGEIVKSILFYVGASNQLAARLGGGASLVEAQSVESHGKALAARISPQVNAIREAVKETISVNTDTLVETRATRKNRSRVNDEVTPVDPAVTISMQELTAKALREAQAATLSTSTEAAAKGVIAPLNSKANMLSKIYLTAKKQTIMGKINKPFVLMLNDVASLTN